MMSGAPTSFPVPWPHEGAARTLEPLAASSGCPGPTAGKDNALPDYSALVNCLRSLPLDLLMRASKILLDRAAHNAFFPWSPVLEGDFDGGKASWLSTRPSSRIMRGLFNKVPIIMGSVRDEGTRFTGMELKSEGDIIQVLQGKEIHFIASHSYCPIDSSSNRN
jgi:acetylcholinesterase